MSGGATLLPPAEIKTANEMIAYLKDNYPSSLNYINCPTRVLSKPVDETREFCVSKLHNVLGDCHASEPVKHVKTAPNAPN